MTIPRILVSLGAIMALTGLTALAILGFWTSAPPTTNAAWTQASLILPFAGALLITAGILWKRSGL